MSLTPSKEVTKGSSVNLTCSSDANPAANYTWYKENEDLPKASGQLLTITDIQLGQGGNYYCKAQNRRGHRNATLHLVVLAGNSCSLTYKLTATVKQANHNSWDADASWNPLFMSWGPSARVSFLWWFLFSQVQWQQQLLDQSLRSCWLLYCFLASYSLGEHFSFTWMTLWSVILSLNLTTSLFVGSYSKPERSGSQNKPQRPKRDRRTKWAIVKSRFIFYSTFLTRWSICWVPGRIEQRYCPLKCNAGAAPGCCGKDGAEPEAKSHFGSQWKWYWPT